MVRSKQSLMTIYSVLTVGAGGFLGTIARYISVLLIDNKVKSFFPYGTLFVNVFGSFILGLVIGLSLREGQQNWRLFLTTGFCGGFTTFSTFALENTNLLQQKLVGVSFAYISITLVTGLLAVAAGIVLGKFVNHQ